MIETLEDLVGGAELRESARRELRRRAEAARILTDPFKFHRDLLCPPEWRENLSDLHREGLEWVNQGKRKKLILWPRKHLKTTLFTQGEALRRALLNPNIRILLYNARTDNSKRFLAAIKGYLRSPRFTALFGNLLPGPNDKYYRNNDLELTLLSRTNLSLREPTFTATGLDAIQTSQHYDLIILDDLVERRNVGSIEQIEKVISCYKDALDLLDPQKELWVLGTRWHPLDLYGWIMENFCDPRCKDVHRPGCKCDFDVMVKQLKDEDGRYICPMLFNDKEAEELLRHKGRAEFAAQYLNNPYDPENCWFRQRDLDAALCDEVPRGELMWYIAVDPAESAEKRSCLTAAVVVGVHPVTGVWYVDEAVGKRVETPGFIDLCFSIYSRYPYPVFGLESHAHKSLAYALKDEMARRRVWFQIVDLKPIQAWAGGNVKEQRIKRLLPLFEFRRIKIRRDLTDLLNALAMLPQASSWDLPDALSYIMDMVPPGMGASAEIVLPRRVVHWKGTAI